MDSFVLNKYTMSSEDKSIIMLGLDILKATEYTDIDYILNKLKSFFGDKKIEYINIDFSSFNSDYEKDFFEKIKTAIRSNSALKIEYKSYEGKSKIRQIVPLK